MKLHHFKSVCLMGLAVMLFSGCSDDDNGPKECAGGCIVGFTCNTATGLCVQDSETPECDPDKNNSCKSEVHYCTSSTMKCTRCKTDTFNCDGDNKTMCEEDQACSIGKTCDPEVRNSCGENDEVYCACVLGTSTCLGAECKDCPNGKFNCTGLGECTDDKECGVPSNCDPDQAFACPSATFEKYCDSADKKCKACPADKFNCDGLDDCSDNSCDITGECTVGESNSCGTALKYCDNNKCEKCATGQFNCNGDNGDKCESSTDCLDANGCVKECSEFYEWECSRRPVGGCQDCAATEDCTKNPRSNGPICDTSDLAGTGFNFCICVSNADCTNSTMGKVCKTGVGVPNPKLKQCSCNTATDCPSSHPLCVGTVFQRCMKKCTDNSDCQSGGSVGTCNTTSGECEYPDY